MAVGTLSGLSLRSLDAGWNRERWEQLPDDGNRYEVIDGVLYMSTSPSFFHQWILGRAHAILDQQIYQAGVGVVVMAPVGVFMPDCDPVQPDLVVIASGELGIVHDRHIYGVPALLVEILSPNNRELETDIKLAAYANAGVPEYWMIRPGIRDVVVCSQPVLATGTFRRMEATPADGELRSATLPVRVRVAELFTGSPDTTL